ncbi:hypothetical protein BGZ88_001825 [Linnemannia elongata]|nr:hypothetical protein BGZ88_001825 [Linnemannia elongata]
MPDSTPPLSSAHLQNSLTCSTPRGIALDVIDGQLTIFKGDIADIHAIKDTLTNHSASTTGTITLASQIISGVGGTPQMEMSLRRPVTIDNPEICTTVRKNIIMLSRRFITQPSTALHKPSITSISTKGVSDVKKDVPFAFRILYHVVLTDPHKDNKDMERLVTENTGNGVAFGGSVIVRPSLLTGDQS